MVKDYNLGNYHIKSWDEIIAEGREARARQREREEEAHVAGMVNANFILDPMEKKRAYFIGVDIYYSNLKDK